MKRLIAAFAAALMLAVGVPGVASAATVIVNVDADNPPLTSVVTDWATNDGISPGKEIEVIDGDTLVFEIANPNTLEPECYGSIILWNQNAEAATATYSNGDTLSPSFAPFSKLKAWTPDSEAMGEGPVTITIPISGKMNPEEFWAKEYGTLAVVSNDNGCDPMNGGPEDWIVYPLIQGAPTDPLTTTTPTLKRNGISFTPDNFDPTCAYEITTSAGTAKQDPVTGEVNVYGVGSGTSVSVTITDCTGATTTVTGKATAATASVQTLTKPTVASSAELITCSAGTSTVNPSSIAYTLFVDGVAVSTRFSDGAIAPSLVATTAAQNLYSGATLSKASWTVDPAWAGKSYSCTTTSYATGAVGIANS